MSTFSLSFLLVILFSTTTIKAQAYKATDHLFVDCGSSTASISNSNQRWEGDEYSKFVPSNITSISFSSTLNHLDSSINDIPYSTARIFNSSSFTYKFLVSQGPKYLRLHFYPATYSNSILNTKKSFFSVSSNGYSLLTNFNAFLTTSFLANKDQLPHFVKEFIIYVEETQTLNVTFTPSPNSYAFINGIEILSMPDNLYFDDKKRYSITALENMYRLNMGGEQISAENDTGMYRLWDKDENYIYGAEIGVTPSCNDSIMYTMDTPNYTAPEAIYQTQRSTGTHSNRYNLTWILPVDAGFYYMLRLHFCNIMPQYTKPDQVVFAICINNQTGDKADIFSWIYGSDQPMFKDYIVFVHGPDGHQNKQDLWLALYPEHEDGDTYLNGLEVFKLSMGYDLSGRNPKFTPDQPSIKGNKKTHPYAAIIGGIGGCFALLSILLVIVLQRRTKAKHSSATNDKQSLPSDRCRRFTLQELKIATNNFHDSCSIGSGGFGKVYKGYIYNATTLAAIKRLNSSSSQGFHEFRTEIVLLSKLRHVHLVSLIGYCEDNKEMVLVYDYMACGTLREHLYKTNKPPLSWKSRLNICIGAAKGLHYLHSGGKRAIIHRDVKSTNILLDHNLVAKVSDFGLSKLGSKDPLQTHVSTMVKGTFGYIDPEYCRTKQLTEKSDVYSFGVVLFEVLCARPAIVQQVRDEQVNLAEWGKTCHRKATLNEIIDPKLSGEIAPGCLRKFGEIASSCVHKEGSERPTMEEVVWGLEFTLELQEAAKKVDDQKKSDSTV